MNTATHKCALCQGDGCFACRPAAPAPAAPDTRVLTTKRGVRVETTLTDAEAYAALARSDADFARKLVKDYRRFSKLTVDQWVWAHKLALEQIEREMAGEAAAGPPPGAHCRRLRQFFLAAQQPSANLPRAVIRTPDGVVGLSLATSGKYKGSVWVNNGLAPNNPANVLYGWVNPGDDLYRPNPGAAQPEWLLGVLSGFDADPEGYCRTYGHATGTCCFCDRPLDDPRSVSAGYGPTCAARYKLPWGG